MTAYIKRGMLKKPEHPNSAAFLALTLLVGCLAIAVGLFGGFREWLLPAMWVVLGLYFVARGIAETLPTRRRRVSVVLRAVAISMLLATIVYLVIATVVFDL